METTRIIEQYLDGTLGDKEKIVLEVKALHDKDLRELISLHKEVNESIRDEDLSVFHSLVKKVSDQHFGKINKSSLKQVTGKLKIWQKNFIRLAAVLIFIAGVGAILRYSQSQGANTEKLYQKYYATYEADAISRSAQSDRVALDSAIISYSRRDYSGAIIKLDEILGRDQKNYLAWFYHGVTCLEIDATAKAIISFNAIPVLWKSPFREHRDWYLALALLRQGNTGKASEAFNRISASGGYYAGRAGEISQKLKP
jgi:tetratricopeptide (TPR) repeat protein